MTSPLRDPVWVSDERVTIGENPLWNPAAQALYWICIESGRILRWQDGQVRQWRMQNRVGSIYLTDSQRLLVALRSSLVWLNLVDDTTQPVRDAGGLPLTSAPEERFNDGRCDRHGNLWIATLDRRVSRNIGSIVRFDARFEAITTATHAIIGNGVCFANDDRTLYFSDSRGRTLHRYQKVGGTLGKRELFATLDDHPGRPDGCTVDAEGCLWSARIGGARIDRYAPDGRRIGGLDLPVAHPTHCTFGGADLATLYVTSARFTDQPPKSRAPDLDGAVLAYDVGVAGTAEFRFSAAGREHG